MRIENEMLSRFNSASAIASETRSTDLSEELNFFFDNVMDTVVDFFNEREEARI